MGGTTAGGTVTGGVVAGGITTGGGGAGTGGGLGGVASTGGIAAGGARTGGAVQGGSVPVDGGALDAAAEGGTAPDAGSRDTVATGDTAVSPDVAVTCSTPDALQCNGNLVEQCSAGVWTAITACSQGCASGACTSQVACAPGATQCYLGTVERCNAAGTAWLNESTCFCGTISATCGDGLCVGYCTPFEIRCNGNARQTCSNYGKWEAATACANGCAQGVCIEESLANTGTAQTLSGKHVYTGCVSIATLGSIRVPQYTDLEIWAKCLTVAGNASIALDTGSKLRFHASETIDIAGTIAGASEIYLDAKQSLTQRGTVKSAQVTLRADTLTLAAGSTTATTGTNPAAALHGGTFVNEAGFAGTISIMPPKAITSPTHPIGSLWNKSNDEMVVSWDKPFPGATGYYVLIGDEVPTAANARLTRTESITFPPNELRAGNNRIRIVTRGTGELGTVPQDGVVTLNTTTPVVSCTTHPDPLAWSLPRSVLLSWTAPAKTGTGYYYIWDRQADTIPTSKTGTLATENPMRIPDQASGTWFFHIVGMDCMGRSTTLATHTRVNIGTQPGFGNLVGTITDSATGLPIANAKIVLNGGMFSTFTKATGDYTFGGTVLSADTPYKVAISAVGYTPIVTEAAVGADSVILSRALTPFAPTQNPYRLGLAYTVEGKAPSIAPLAAIRLAPGPMDQLIYATRTGEFGYRMLTRGLTDFFGNRFVLEEDAMFTQDDGGPTVGWTGSLFFTVIVNPTADDLGNPSGWRMASLRVYPPSATHYTGDFRVLRYGHLASPTAIWNGTNIGVFMVSYGDLVFREMTPAGTYANGLAEDKYTKVATLGTDLRDKAGLRGVWNGSQYAVLATANQKIYWGRYGRDVVPAAVVELDAISDLHAMDIVWDGLRHHVAYARPGIGGQVDLVIRPVSENGVVGTATTATQGSTAQVPALAFDGRYLLIAAGNVVQVRDTATHALVQTLDLGAAQVASVGANPSTGQTVIGYTRPGETNKLVIRSLDRN